jgi:RNA polymerase sigma-70 factor (sigma-E family)
LGRTTLQRVPGVFIYEMERTLVAEPPDDTAEVVRSPSREEAVAALFDRYYGSLRGLAVVILGDATRAEEAVMEAFVKLYSRWGSIERLDWPPAYLRQMVVNQCRSRLRRDRIEERVNEVFHRRAGRTSRSGDVESSMDLWAAVRKLPDRQRVSVVLRYVEDMTEREIADTLDCSVGTVKSQLFKARRKLERLLGPGAHGGEER